MNTKQKAALRQAIRAAKSDLWTERNVIMQMARVEGYTHGVLLTDPQQMEGDEGPLCAPLLYGPESYCQTKVGTIYPIGEIAKALE